MKSNETGKKKETAEHLSPQEKVYPLNFLCRYVIERRGELAAFETQELKDSIQIMDVLQDLLHRMDDACAGKDAVSVRDVAAARHKLVEILATVRRHRAQLTRKGLIFEDLNNMLVQAEPLIHHLLFYDNLVDAYNRYFYVSYSQDLYTQAQERGGLSMAFFDIDNFKQYNTDFGHETGDRVLKTVCDLIQRSFHARDGLYLIRMGGDEFVILDAGALGYERFLRLLTEVRQAIASDRSIYGRTVTVSMGASNAEADAAGCTWDLYCHADERLYMAKNHGKNQIVHVG